MGFFDALSVGSQIAQGIKDNKGKGLKAGFKGVMDQMSGANQDEKLDQIIQNQQSLMQDSQKPKNNMQDSQLLPSDPSLTSSLGEIVNPTDQAAINVGMPGSTPVPAGVAQNLMSPVQAGGKILSPINMNPGFEALPEDVQNKILKK